MKADEELVGSTGSRIHYRAERHDPHILFRQSEPVVDMGGRRVRLRDFSLSGVTVTLPRGEGPDRSEEHTSELQSLMRISYAVFCLKKKKKIETAKIQQSTSSTKST